MKAGSVTRAWHLRDAAWRDRETRLIVGKEQGVARQDRDGRYAAKCM